MKVLLINTSERTGGAAVAAGRLMKALQKAGIEVNMLVRDRQTGAPDVYTVSTSGFRRRINRLRFIWERLVIFVCNGFNRTDLFRVSVACTGTDISRHPQVRDADIIHLHWINQGFLSVSDLKKLAGSGKPVVWTLHDMWPCTGICHHARECDHFTGSCGKCFYLNSTRSKDLSSRIFKAKQQLAGNDPFSFVCCSMWLKANAQKSAITKRSRILSIPNPVDTAVFRPVERIAARRQLHLPQDKYLLLFGALNVSDERKGIDYLINGLIRLKTKAPEIFQRIGLVVFGQVKAEIKGLNLPVHPMGYLTDEQQIVALYNAADLFVTPSLEDNLPNTIMEAMACGTPCVGFNTGGIPEMIDHKRNGYVARYKDTEDLVEGIEWVLENREKEQLSAACLEKVRTYYTEPTVAKQYISLYKELLSHP